MKKSELKASIREEINNILSEVTPEDVKNQEEYNTELEKTVKLKKSADLNEEEDEDKEPTKSQLKGDSIAFLATKLQQTTKEMKSTVNKWKTAEGQEKKRLTDRLRELTKIKKEIEASL
jgi:hypothetical protein|tara:strand:- start:60 stop:416 length:357 start_codon:yes stop_codon:yes gene_type:complete